MYQVTSGKDILPGTYKLETNLVFDSRFSILGWDFKIYNVDTEKWRNQRFNYSAQDVLVKLNENEIIIVEYDLSTDLNPDDIKLIFKKVK